MFANVKICLLNAQSMTRHCLNMHKDLLYITFMFQEHGSEILSHYVVYLEINGVKLYLLQCYLVLHSFMAYEVSFLWQNWEEIKNNFMSINSYPFIALIIVVSTFLPISLFAVLLGSLNKSVGSSIPFLLQCSLWISILYPH